MPQLTDRNVDAVGWTNAQQGQRHPPLRRDHSCVQHNNFAIIYGGYQSKPLGDMWVLDCGTFHLVFPLNDHSIDDVCSVHGMVATDAPEMQRQTPGQEMWS